MVSHVPENKTVDQVCAVHTGSSLALPYGGTTRIGNSILNCGAADSRLESCEGQFEGFFRPLRVPTSANGNLACQPGLIGRCLARKARYAIDGRLTFQWHRQPKVKQRPRDEQTRREDVSERGGRPNCECAHPGNSPADKQEEVSGIW